MTVSQLIEHLRQFPADMPVAVVVPWDTDGPAEAKEISPLHVAPHEDVDGVLVIAWPSILDER